MNFICAHCEKPITCSAIVIDWEFLHSTCEASFNEAKEIDSNELTCS